MEVYKVTYIRTLYANNIYGFEIKCDIFTDKKKALQFAYNKAKEYYEDIGESIDFDPDGSYSYEVDYINCNALEIYMEYDKIINSSDIILTTDISLLLK
jgi:hypothetical protein